MSGINSANDDDDKQLDAAKKEVAECEKEIAAIKAKLRSLSSDNNEQPHGSSSSSSNNNNSLTIQWIKIDGLPEGAEPKLTLQLSSPIEEVTLDALYDSAAAANTDESTAGVANFCGVETGQATLTVSAFDADIPLGNSKAHDVAAFTNQLLLDPMLPAESYTYELVMPIYPEGKQTDDEAICTVHFKTVYKPSEKDQKEELYELLNRTTQRKSAAVEKLRQASMAVARRQAEAAAAASGSSSSRSAAGSSGSAAVKPGFLNKKKKDTLSKWKIWYQRAAVIVPIAKNYILFAAFIGLTHFHGQKLAIPAPV